jgi:hypothetical protein
MMTVSGWVCDTCLIWLGLNLLFLWKPIQKSQGQRINEVCQKAKDKGREVFRKVDALIPRYVEPVKRD